MSPMRKGHTGGPANTWRTWLERAQDLGPLDLTVSLWALFALSIAQPLLELLGRNPQFFLARAAPSSDIVMVAVVVLLIIPVVLVSLVLAARAIHPLAGVVTHGLLFAVLGALLVVNVLERTPVERADGLISVAIGLATGISAWFAYTWFETPRSMFRLVAVAPLIVLILFLVFSPTSQLIAAADPIDRPAGVQAERPAPVVVIVFDEFPIASLIDPEGNILEDAYPNFGRLADDGIWFRNAVTVEQQTEHAIPTMLTGRRPVDREAIPSASDYPLTLFSLLSDQYEIRAVESVTELCPDYACENRSRVVAPLPQRWVSTGFDLGVVTGHLLLPDDLSTWLPSINNTWGDFAGATVRSRNDFDIVARFNEYVDADRRDEVDRFLDLIDQPSSQPTLYFSHVLLPHIPWTYLPSGQSYFASSPAPGSTPTGWGPDEWLVMQAYQRHLLQVQYADRIVGDVIGAMEDAGIYRDSLVVVTADHGTADVPGVEHRRVIKPETVGHIAAIPLFVKLPDMEQAGIDDYRAETIDVLPTIADALDLEIPWSVEGTSLVMSSRPERTSTTTRGPQGEVTFGVDGEEKLEVASWKAGWFTSSDPHSLVPSPELADLLGVGIHELSIQEEPELRVRIDNPQWYDEVDLDGDPVPARLTGTVTRGDGPAEDLILAVALNDVVRALVRTYETEDGRTRFQAMLPLNALQMGSNQIDVFIVDGSDDAMKLLDPGG